ncbi:hypothetical protein HGB13_00560 [bacterium]|nr:hypothetical protein [bacterium]
MKKWTEKDEAFLIEKFPSWTIIAIAKALGRGVEAVERKARRLGLKKPETEISISTIRDDVQKIIKKEESANNAKKLKIVTQELLLVEKERDAMLGVGRVETYSIKSKEKDGKLSSATAVVLASDWHIEEPVKKSQVNGLNEYNMTIAKERSEKFFEVVAKLIKVHKKEYNIENLVLALLGDFISGSIHDDLMESNLLPPTVAIWEAQNLIASGIEYLLKETDVNLVIPCSSGNHGRTTDKQRVSTEYGNSLEILMYHQMEKYFAGNPRVKFIINDSYLTYVNIYGFTCRFHHGHALKYGGGIGGIFIPVFKAISQWDKSKQADWTFFGHFHQLKDGGNFISNGSLIGFNAFAVKIKADYEKPKQAFCIIDEERGMDVVRKITL